MDKKNFIVRPEEKYICENCGKEVIGGRYNNHCPYCLWSKHVDREIPGDRASSCLGLMEPIGVIKKGDKWRIIHRCQTCGKKTINDTNDKDNRDLIIQLSQKPVSLK